jgi:hypothetical protein
MRQVVSFGAAMIAGPSTARTSPIAFLRLSLERRQAVNTADGYEREIRILEVNALSIGWHRSRPSICSCLMNAVAFCPPSAPLRQQAVFA